MSIQGKVIAITGASSGIGEAAARELAARGATVLVGARRTDRLETLVADLRNTMTARGVRMWFDNPVPKLGNRSPQQLLDEDAAGHRTALIEFVRGGLR